MLFKNRDFNMFLSLTNFASILTIGLFLKNEYIIMNLHFNLYNNENNLWVWFKNKL